MLPRGCRLVELDFAFGSLLVKYQVSVPNNTSLDTDELTRVITQDGTNLTVDPNSVTIITCEFSNITLIFQ